MDPVYQLAGHNSETRYSNDMDLIVELANGKRISAHFAVLLVIDCFIRNLSVCFFHCGRGGSPASKKCWTKIIAGHSALVLFPAIVKFNIPSVRTWKDLRAIMNFRASVLLC